MESQTCWGLRLSLTSPSMMAGSWVSIKALHCSSMLAPRSPPRVWHSSLKNCTIWSSVVSLVMKLSEVGDDVDADGAGELVPALGDGEGGGHQGGEEEEGHLHHLACLVVFGAFL